VTLGSDEHARNRLSRDSEPSLALLQDALSLPPGSCCKAIRKAQIGKNHHSPETLTVSLRMPKSPERGHPSLPGHRRCGGVSSRWQDVHIVGGDLSLAVNRRGEAGVREATCASQWWLGRTRPGSIRGTTPRTLSTPKSFPATVSRSSSSPGCGAENMTGLRC